MTAVIKIKSNLASVADVIKRNYIDFKIVQLVKIVNKLQPFIVITFTLGNTLKSV